MQEQSNKVKRRISNIEVVSDREARELVMEDEEEFYKFLYYTSARYIKRIDEPKNSELKEILGLTDETMQIDQFNKYLSKEEIA